MHKAIDSDVASAVHAITQRITNTKQILITPIWPITTLAGNRDLALAAFIMLGPKKDDPIPAHVKDIERIMIVRVWFFVPNALTAAIPTRNEIPDDTDATLVK
jgi:hypothetical protein